LTDETSKTRAVRHPQFASTYLHGRIIDIGCGPDLVVPSAEPFDLGHGDAQFVADVRPHEAYDTVHSSHCLEHMKDVPNALSQWWSLVRKGGYLILVVPDEDLYEQGGWPSLFNTDHKATFRATSSITWSPVSYDIRELVCRLENAELVSCERQDAGYNHTLRRTHITYFDRLLFMLQRRTRGIIRRIGIRSIRIDGGIRALFSFLGAPVDQTDGPALAQIQVIVKKRAS
jgi:SAM-dependent methyltransferase